MSESEWSNIGRRRSEIYQAYGQNGEGHRSSLGDERSRYETHTLALVKWLVKTNKISQ